MYLFKPNFCLIKPAPTSGYALMQQNRKLCYIILAVMYRTYFKTNKYNAKRTIAKDGLKRDSKFEASIADELLFRKQAGDIKGYESQFKVEMWAYNKDGRPVMKKTHKVDFRILHNDNSYELLEAKGIETADYRDRRRWLETFWLPEHPDHTYTIVKQHTSYRR